MWTLSKSTEKACQKWLMPVLFKSLDPSISRRRSTWARSLSQLIYFLLKRAVEWSQRSPKKLRALRITNIIDKRTPKADVNLKSCQCDGSVGVFLFLCTKRERRQARRQPAAAPTF